MKAFLEFDEKEFWIQLFSIVARREEKTEGKDISSDSAPESALSQGGASENALHSSDVWAQDEVFSQW
jgi:hypothetical protein